MASFGITDSTQWLSVNEEALFLHDGLIRVTDLVELPRDVSASQTDTENEVVSFDTKDPAELTDRLLAVCGKHNNAYAYSRLLEYRLNALKGLWSAHRHMKQQCGANGTRSFQPRRNHRSPEEAGSVAASGAGFLLQ